MPQVIAAADVFVVPSLSEASSNSMREALAMEKPVIATRVGDASEVIKHGRNGLIVEPAGVKHLAEALRYLLINKKISAQLGVEARKTIEERYSWNTTVSRILEIYSQVIEENE
jgi:glycosyltransferase involved in cell wall biosynthesis